MTNDLWNPEQYEKFKAQRSRPFWDLADLVDPKGVRSAIDLGCGTGELTAGLQGRLPSAEILGIDSSEAMLEKAEKFQTSLLRFEKRDLRTYAPSGRFDLVFSNAALQWLPDHEALFLRVLGWVAPGGQIAIQMPYNFDHPSHRIAQEVARDFEPFHEGPAPGPRMLAQERYSMILVENGFLDQRCRLEIYLHPMASGADVIEWTKGTRLTFYQERLSPEDFQVFMERYRERLLAEIGTGPYLYAFKRILMWGRRDRAMLPG